MFFVAFDEVQRNQQSKFSSFYSKLTFSFKLFLLVSFGFLLHNVITLNGLLFANIPTKTFTNLQVWRIFTAPFSTLDGLYGLMSIIIGFWWLLSLFPGYQRKYSSIHLIMQVIVQNFLIQIIYGLVVILLVKNTYFYETYNDFFFSLGWIPIVIIWIFKYTGENKQQKMNFCFLPFLIKGKYLAWVISISMILLTIQKLPLIIATILGAVQFHFFHCSLNRIPLGLYICLQKPFCLCARLCSSFVKVQSVKHKLAILLGYRQDQLLRQQHHSQNQMQQNSEMGGAITDMMSTNNQKYVKKKDSQIELVASNKQENNENKDKDKEFQNMDIQ